MGPARQAWVAAGYLPGAVLLEKLLQHAAELRHLRLGDVRRKGLMQRQAEDFMPGRTKVILVREPIGV